MWPSLVQESQIVLNDLFIVLTNIMPGLHLRFDCLWSGLTSGQSRRALSRLPKEKLYPYTCRAIPFCLFVMVVKCLSSSYELFPDCLKQCLTYTPARQPMAENLEPGLKMLEK